MKYLGSKNKLSKDLVPIIQSYITDCTIAYIEPFVGGANMIDKIKCKRKIGNDTNKYLIALFKEINKYGTKIIPEEISREHYKSVKEDYLNNGNRYEDWYKGLIGFCGAFRSKFFDSCACYDYESGGKIRNNYKESIRNLIKQSKNLKDIEFNVMNFLNIDDSIHDCVIYCDPPYFGTYNYNINFPYEKFYEWCKKMNIYNTVLISEYNMPEDFKCIWSKNKTMCLMADSNRNVVTEKLFIVK